MCFSFNNKSSTQQHSSVCNSVINNSMHSPFNKASSLPSGSAPQSSSHYIVLIAPPVHKLHLPNITPSSSYTTDSTLEAPKHSIIYHHANKLTRQEERFLFASLRHLLTNVYATTLLTWI